MSTLSRQLTWGMAGAMILAAAQNAAGDGGSDYSTGRRSGRNFADQRMGDQGFYQRFDAEVDIESLKATLRRVDGQWDLAVRCEVEIEDAHPAERFDLMLRVTERGRELADERGRPLRTLIPLDRPTDIDDDEIEFKESLDLYLPAGSFSNPDRLRIWAKVLSRDDGRVLERKDKSIKVRGRRTVTVRSGRTVTVRSGRRVHWTGTPRIRSTVHRRTVQRTSAPRVRGTTHRRTMHRRGGLTPHLRSTPQRTWSRTTIRRGGTSAARPPHRRAGLRVSVGSRR